MMISARLDSARRLAVPAAALLLWWLCVGVGPGLADEPAADREWLPAPVSTSKRGMDLTVPGLRAAEFAVYAAVRFGEGENDIAYLVFDCEARLKPYDRLYVYVPEHPKYSKPVRLSAKNREEGQIFRSISLKGRYGAVDHDCSLIVTGRTKWDAAGLEVFVDAQCGLRNSETRERNEFGLSGQIDATLNPAVAIPCACLIQDPRLDVHWDHRSDPPHVRARMTMGSLGLDPAAGFKRKATVEVRVGDDEKAQYRQAVAITPSGVRREFLHYVRMRLRPSTEYYVRLTVDMRPLFGIVEAGDKMVLR